MYTLYICILSLSEFKFYSEVYRWREHKAFNDYMYNHNKILVETMKYVKEFILINTLFLMDGIFMKFNDL